MTLQNYAFFHRRPTSALPFCDKCGLSPSHGKSDSRYRNFREPNLSHNPQTTYFCSDKTKKDMNHLTTIWILTVGCLFLIFLFRSIQKMRKETGHGQIFEIGNENVYDEYDDDEQ